MSTPTIAIFRQWPSGAITALFPEEPTDAYGQYCTSYERLGGHSGADYTAVIAATFAVDQEDCPELRGMIRDLKSRYGYDLDIRTRATKEMHDKRIRAAMKLSRKAA